MYIPKIGDYLKILANDKVNDLYFKSTREKLHFKLNEEQNLRKVVKLLYIFLTTPDEREKYPKMMQSNSSDNCVHYYNMILNLFDPKLQLINTKPMINKKLKELLSELKKFKFQTILVLEY